MAATRIGFALALLIGMAPKQAAAPVEMLLTEVLFAPRPGDTSFVELANFGEGPVDLSTMVLGIDSIIFPLPRLASPVAPGGRVLIRFDGGGTFEGSVVHANAGVVLNPAGGVVTLVRNDRLVLDRVAWGIADGAVRQVTGGRASSRVPPGSSFGRPPGANRPGFAVDWVLYSPDQITPGRANPLPPVLQLLPLNGAILESSAVDLGWYAVSGAARYRVQLASDTSFRQPLFDQTVTEPTMNTGTLSPGVYWWRVQALGADSTRAAWSPAARLELEAPGRGGGGGGGGGSGPSAGDDLDFGSQSGPKVLINVPYLTQHKDTRLLLLESKQEGRPRTAGMFPAVPHQWDGDHGNLDKRDPADKTNCGLASMAMINRFYGGDLSQDRIGYEMFSRNVSNYAGRVNVTTIRGVPGSPLKEHTPGPEFDLNYNGGLSDEQMLAEGLFALGTLPGPGSGYMSPDSIWDLVVPEIDAGRPLMGYTCCHLFVVRGYELRAGQRLIYLNDPWSGQYAYDLGLPGAAQRLGKQMEGVLSYPTHPQVKRQESSVTRDSDGDGVMDFDEVERFKTNPNAVDSDADGVQDKQDIESGVYEIESFYGYAWYPGASLGRDYDHDGTPTELDADSDNGGCKDGDEDVNGDGERAGRERSNFDQTDDMCGNLQGSVSYLIEAVSIDTTQPIKIIHDQGVILVRFKPDAPGSDHYVDNGSTFSYQGYARIEVNLNGCVLWGYEEAHGGGPFPTGADIGATRGDDGTLAFGALADVPAQTSTGGCGASGSGQAERTLAFPDCDGRLAPAQPGVSPTYSFDCTKPNPPPGMTITRFYARGFIRVQ